MIGQVCVKVAGRDAGKICVIIEDLGKGLVLIEGDVRRRRCNLKHLEFLDDIVRLKKGASHAEVVKVLKSYGLVERKGKIKPKAVRPKRKRKSLEKVKKSEVKVKPKKEEKSKKEVKKTKKVKK